MSISIIEKNQNNSGIPQGNFLMRRKVLKSDGSGLLVTPDDFVVGGTIDIYGKTIHLTDCDDYTREFYQGAQQPPES
jgi:hypothetical protein